MKEVMAEDSLDRGMLWYPFHASNMVFFMFLGHVLARLNGEGVWFVSRLDTLFTLCRSTVRLGDPSCLGATTMRLHHSVAVPAGTGSITPSLTSLSRPSFTFFFQWCGTGMGVCTAFGTAPSSRWMCIGSPDISGISWCSQTLNAVAL